MLLKNVDTRRKRCCICAISAVASVVFGIWHAVMLCRYFEPETGLYAVGAPSRTPLYVGITAFSVLLLAAVLTLLSKNGSITVSEENTAFSREPRWARCVRIACGACMGIGAVVRAVGMLSGKLSYSLSPLLASLSVILQLVFVAYFSPELLSLVLGNDSGKVLNLRAVCGMSGIVLYALEALELYVDQSVPVSSEYRRITVLCLLVLMLFFAAEIRMRISAPRGRRYAFMTCFSAVICTGTYIGGLVAYLAHGAGFCNGVLQAVFGVVATAYVDVRLVCCIFENDGNEGRMC